MNGVATRQSAHSAYRGPSRRAASTSGAQVFDDVATTSRSGRAHRHVGSCPVYRGHARLEGPAPQHAFENTGRDRTSHAKYRYRSEQWHVASDASVACEDSGTGGPPPSFRAVGRLLTPTGTPEARMR